ncbi:MAG: hypothetical protein FRX49_01248 [Trebouxia sp. A1-2]|nr:MAG: hypothetical protein FRX49_01248 [Trebouxia sp. A1-2]
MQLTEIMTAKKDDCVYARELGNVVLEELLWKSISTPHSTNFTRKWELLIMPVTFHSKLYANTTAAVEASVKASKLTHFSGCALLLLSTARHRSSSAAKRLKRGTCTSQNTQHQCFPYSEGSSPRMMRLISQVFPPSRETSTVITFRPPPEMQGQQNLQAALGKASNCEVTTGLVIFCKCKGHHQATDRFGHKH